MILIIRIFKCLNCYQIKLYYWFVYLEVQAFNSEILCVFHFLYDFADTYEENLNTKHVSNYSSVTEEVWKTFNVK